MKLEATLKSLLPAQMRGSIVPIADHTASLLPPEAQSIASAVRKRQMEFSTGRYVARKLLAEFDFPPSPLLPSGTRLPGWPDGMIGSISHSPSYCGVVLARQENYGGTGIDVESAEPLKRKLWSRICRPDELRFLGPQNPGLDVKLHFSIKEAIYKAHFPITGVALGFHDISLQLSLEQGQFRGQVMQDSTGAATAFEVKGRFAVANGHVLALVALSPDQAESLRP